MILEAFERMKRQLTMRELAVHCGLPSSSCHAVVQTLLRRGYLYTLGRRKELYPNPRILTLAQEIVAHDPFLERMAEELEVLRDVCGETVTVAKRQGDAAFQYIYALDCPRPIRYAAKAGDYRPLHSSASGKALLSTMSDEALDDWFKSNRLEAITSRTITGSQALMKDIKAGRARGYFVTAGEYAEDLDAVAVPVKLHSDVVAVALAGPSSRMRAAKGKFADQLLALKRRLEV